MESYKGLITRRKRKQNEKIRESSSFKEEKDQIMADREERNQDHPENQEPRRQIIP